MEFNTGNNYFFLLGSDTTPWNQYRLSSHWPDRKVRGSLLLPRSCEKVKSGQYPTISCSSPSPKLQSPQRRDHFCNPDLPIIRNDFIL